MNNQLLRVNKSIVFVGMMGCGKSTVARGIAKVFGIPFIDTDHKIELEETIKITQIFKVYGENYFRAKEEQAIRNSLAQGVCSIAVGGGAYLQPNCRKIIDSTAVSVWLDSDIKILWNRVNRKSSRPLLMTENPYETLCKLVRERTPIYRKAQIHIRSDDNAVKRDTVNNIVKALLAAPIELGLFSKRID